MIVSVSHTGLAQHARLTCSCRKLRYSDMKITHENYYVASDSYSLVSLHFWLAFWVKTLIFQVSLAYFFSTSPINIIMHNISE